MSSSTSHPLPQPHDGEQGPPRPGDPLVLHPDDFQVTTVDLRPGAGAGRHDQPVQQVSSARGSHTEDVARRMRNYAISMGIRTLCVVVAVLAFPHWYAWLFVPGAVLLPYVAVVLANDGRERAPRALPGVPHAPTRLPVRTGT